MKLNKKHIFSGRYKGISFEISHHGLNDEWREGGTWCYYLYINEKQLPEEYRKDFILEPVFDDKGRVSHKYYDSKIADLDWHCGITYYGKEFGVDGEPIVIKIGCDYAHLWDEGHHYDENYILSDVKSSIDKLFEIFPEMKVWSQYYGGYFKLSEGEINEHGNFIAFEEKERWMDK